MMKKRSLWKDMLREMLQTKARFLSIFAIIMLGVGFFTGIKSAGPNMLQTGNAYYRDTGLMDLKVQSSTGLTPDSLETLRKLPLAGDVQPGYTLDAFLDQSGLITKVLSYREEQPLNRYRVLSGRLPAQSGEIALDDGLREKHHYALGDTVEFSNPEGVVPLQSQLKTLSYKVVGFVASPLYVENNNRGSSSIGKGKADAFAVVPEENFQLPVYTEAYIRFAGSGGHEAYSEDYTKLTAEYSSQVESALADVLSGASVYVTDRTGNPGYLEYKSNADRVSALATAFPVFFFLIAALVSLTTMTRMVEERRLQIGTLKALGYGKGDIMLKFLLYGSLASVAGWAAGLAIGFTMFPTIIFNAYQVLYNFPDLKLDFYYSYAAVSLAVSLLCTTITAYVAAKVELRSNASVLMRPRAPKSGQRILLERLTFIWRRMSFVQKVTARNLFRYKQRMFMTVAGVAGCTALILTGFGLKDSIGSIADKQFGGIMKYSISVAFHADSNPASTEAYNKLVESEQGITGRLDVQQEAVQAKKPGAANQEAIVFVPSQKEQIQQFVTLRERGSGAPVELGEEGAVITEKLSKLFGLALGDTLELNDPRTGTYQVKVAAIVENYVLHYVYMSPGYYASVFGKEPVYNTQLLNASTSDPAWEKELGEKLTANSRVALATFSSTVGTAFEDTMKSMDIVIVVLIVSAAALAFVVLYNLTNINVSERIRELSTIKVLGFYDKEVTLYIYRENILLSLLGIGAGCVLGVFLHRFILTTAELDATMFSPVIKWISYVISGLLTLLFSGIVMAFMHVRLKHVDMIEALKSVE